MIAELEQKLRAQSLDDLSDRLAELQAEHEGLKRDLAEDGEEVRRLTEGPESEQSLLDTMEGEIRSEKERLADLEKQLEAKSLEQESAEEDMSLQEEELKMRKEDLE
jgi:chromosome segregation ATPase